MDARRATSPMVIRIGEERNAADAPSRGNPEGRDEFPPPAALGGGGGGGSAARGGAGAAAGSAPCRAAEIASVAQAK
jgi:hypothetical protein